MRADEVAAGWPSDSNSTIIAKHAGGAAGSRRWRLLCGDLDYALRDAIVNVVANADKVTERASGEERAWPRRAIRIILALDAPRRRHDEHRVGIDVEQPQIFSNHGAGNGLRHIHKVKAGWFDDQADGRPSHCCGFRVAMRVKMPIQ